MLDDAEYGMFEMVVVKDISRFSRNTVDFLTSVRRLKALGIEVLFLSNNMSVLGNSEFILTIFSALAQEESANLSKRVKFGKKVNAKKGRVPQRIFGYDRIDNFTLAINEIEAEIVREIYHLYLEHGLGCRTISIELNRLGRKTKYACEWNPRGVRRVLTNSIYCGVYVNNKYEIADFIEGKQVKLDPSQHFIHDRPDWAIIDKDTFEKTQQLLSERRSYYENEYVHRTGRYSKKHIFSTLIKCEHCGRSYTRKTYTYVNTRVYWRCVTNDQYTSEKCPNRTNIDEGELLGEIKAYLSSIIEDRGLFVKSVLDEFQVRKPKSTNTSKAELEKEKERLMTKKEKFQDMYANDVITMDELKQKIQTIRTKLNEIENRLLELMKGHRSESDAGELVKKHILEIEGFLNMETVTNSDMRQIIDRIVVNEDGEVKIMLKVLKALESSSIHCE